MNSEILLTSMSIWHLRPLSHLPSLSHSVPPTQYYFCSHSFEPLHKLIHLSQLYFPQHLSSLHQLTYIPDILPTLQKLIMLFFTLILACLATSVNIARQGADFRIRYAAAPVAVEESESLSSEIPSASSLAVLVTVAAISKPMWIRDFLSFKKSGPEFHALETPKEPEHKPVRTRIINYGPMLANEGNLTPFTRHLVELLKEDYVAPEQKAVKRPVIELDIEQFIAYLIEHRGFTENQLNFLRQPELDYGYDTIEKELTQIKRQLAVQRHITIGGELSGALPSGTSLAVFAWSLLLLLI